ncbi:MAG: hypothetical protein WCJ56_10585 [bacterium]
MPHATIGQSALLCLLFVLACIVGLGGCSSGGSELVSDVRLKSTVAVLPTDGSVTVSNVTETNLILTGGSAPVPGQVLVSTKDAGWMRKVTGVATQPNGSWLVTTIPATLEDVVQSGSIRVHGSLLPEDVAQSTLAPGVTLQPRFRAPYQYTFTMNNYALGGGATGSGVINLNVDYVADYDFSNDGHLSHALIKITLSGLSAMDVKFSDAFQSNGSNTTYATFQWAPIPITGTPLVFTPSLSLSNAMVGNCEAHVTVQPVVSCNGFGQLEITRLADGSYTVSHDGNMTYSGSFKPTQANAFCKANFELDPIILKFDFKLQNVPGPTFYCNAPGFSVLWNATLDANSPISVLALSAKNSLTLDVPGGTFAQWAAGLGSQPASYTLVNRTDGLANKTFNPGNSNVELH